MSTSNIEWRNTCFNCGAPCATVFVDASGIARCVACHYMVFGSGGFQAEASSDAPRERRRGGDYAGVDGRGVRR